MKPKQNRSVRVPTTKEDVARVMRRVARKHSGRVPEDSYVVRLQRAEAKHAAAKKKGAV